MLVFSLNKLSERFGSNVKITLTFFRDHVDDFDDDNDGLLDTEDDDDDGDGILDREVVYFSFVNFSDLTIRKTRRLFTEAWIPRPNIF